MNKLYRKTALIEATQWFKMGDHPAVIMKDGVPWVETLEGGHEVTPSDWIATGVKGEHWPIKADVFAASYEEADTTAQAEIEALRHTLADRNNELHVVIARSQEWRSEAEALRAEVERLRAEWPSALMEQACCLGLIGKNVIIDCETRAEAEEILDWLCGERVARATLTGSKP